MACVEVESVASAMNLIEKEPGSREGGSEVRVELELRDVGEGRSPEVQAALSTSGGLEEELHELLSTRPSVAAGRQLSIRRPRSTRSAFRRESRYSLPHSARRPPDQSDGRLEQRRSRSFPDLNFASADVALEEVEEEDFGGGFAEVRRSSRRLKERIEERRQASLRRPQTAQLSAWAHFKVVRWPKIKSRLRVLTSYELWRGHMKEVEGHFGTAVVSYFVFLRWVFIMNLIIFAFWFGFVIVPQIVWEHARDPPHTTSLLSCVYQYQEDLNETRACPLGKPIPVFATPRECLDDPEDFGIRLCKFERNDSGIFVADRESSRDDIQVTKADNESLMTEHNCTEPFEAYMLCEGGIDPYVEWYQYLLDFVLGQGELNETVLFHGWYANTTVTEHDDYDMPVVFLVLVGFVYLVSVMLLVYKMGHAYNESYVEFGSKRKANFCNKVFTAWDFNITDSKTAKIKRAHIRTNFEEELADHIKRNTVRTAKERAKVVLIRIVTNTFTVLVLAGSGAVIYYVAEYSLDALTSSSLSPEGLVLPLVITTFNIVLPFMFSFLARFEKFKTQGGEIKMTLIRAILVRLSSLVILLISLFILIDCTQTSSDVEGEEEEEDECEFDPFSFIRNGTAGRRTEDNCPECWETFFGQEFYKLGLANFVVSSVSSVSVETFRNFASRFKWKGLGEKLGKGTFDIPKSILDLIYTQALLWLGFMFCPLLPAIILPTSFILFYIKKYSLLINLEPDKRGTFRSARTNFLFLLLMLLTLFAVLVPIGYTIARVHPSPTCGPFREKQYMYTVINELVDDVENCEARQFLDYLGSSGFVVPAIVLLLLIVYAQYVTLRSRKLRFNLIKKQLILEGANVTHIVGKLDRVLQRLADQRALHETSPVAGPQYHLPDRIQQIRESQQQDTLTVDT